MTKLLKTVPPIRVDDETYEQIMQRVDAECARQPYATRTDILRDVLRDWSAAGSVVPRETPSASQRDTK